MTLRRTVVRLSRALRQRFAFPGSSYEVLKDQGNKTVRLSLENAEEVSIDALLSDRKNAIVTLQPVIKNLEQKIRFRYVIHKWSFIFGIVLIAISRAVPGILAIADQL